LRLVCRAEPPFIDMRCFLSFLAQLLRFSGNEETIASLAPLLLYSNYPWLRFFLNIPSDGYVTYSMVVIATRLPPVALPRGEAESCDGGPQKEMYVVWRKPNDSSRRARTLLEPGKGNPEA
jgi:hypothetical protein